MATSLVMVIFFTNPFLINLTMRAWEIEAVKMNTIEEPFDVAIVLGGFSSVLPDFTDRLHLNANPNRLVNAVELYHLGKVRKVLVSGGSSKVLGPKLTDAEPVRRFLLAVGVRSEDIWIESKSRNTGENAQESAVLLKDHLPDARCLLVTSAFHMRRSLACFRKVGIEVVPFSTDLTVNPLISLSFGNLIVPDVNGFSKWGLLIKEWLGMFAYRLKGYV